MFSDSVAKLDSPQALRLTQWTRCLHKSPFSIRTKHVSTYLARYESQLL